MSTITPEKLTPAEILERHRYKGKLTPMFREKALDMVHQGAPPRTALRALGCADSTIRAWQSLAQTGEKDGKYALFWRDMADAEQETLSRVAANATKATDRDGKAALDYLGRRDPENWGKKDTLDVNVSMDLGPTFRAVAEAQQKLVSGEYRLEEGENAIQGFIEEEGSEQEGSG